MARKKSTKKAVKRGTSKSKKATTKKRKVYQGSKLTGGGKSVPFFAESETRDLQSSVPQYAVQRGTPLSDHTAFTGDTLTLEGWWVDKKAGSRATAGKNISTVEKWQKLGTRLTWHGARTVRQLIVSEHSFIYDSTKNAVKATVTLTRVRLATNPYSKKKGKGKKKPSGKKKATSGGKNTTKKYVTVKSGDTYSLYKVRYGSTIKQLRAWNKYKDTGIPIGVRVRVK